MDSNPLNRMQLRTQELTALKLRSAATVMAALHVLILEAHRFGYSHPSIHASLRAGGLGVTWNTYRSALRRMKRKAESTAPAPTDMPASATSVPGPDGGGGTPLMGRAGVDTDAPAPADLDAPPPPPRAAAMHALAALREARACGGRDYAQAARALNRRPQP